MRVMRRAIALGLVVGAAAMVDGCGSKSSTNEAPTDPQFEADYRDDYEADAVEDRAEAAEEADLDLYDDLDDLEAATSAPLFHTASPPKGRRIHGAVTILQDNAYFTYADDATLTERFLEARDLGADVVRYFLSWRDTQKRDSDPSFDHDPLSTTRPSFDATNPDEYDWSALDKFFDGVKYTAGRQVLVTMGGPIPWWGSDDPQHCADRNPAPGAPPKDSCYWQPNPREFAMWATALGRHLVQSKRIPWGITLWNEPNMSYFLSDDGGTLSTVDDHVAIGLRYRKLWFVGRKALRTTAELKTRVLFGDMANGLTTPSHWTTFLYALCMADPADPAGTKPPCVADPRKVYTAGVAYHPYANDPSLVMKSVQTLEGLIDQATAEGKMSKGRYVYLTEHGFRTHALVEPPPASLGGPAATMTPDEQAVQLNVLDHLVFADARIRSIANFLVMDEGDGKWDTGFVYNDVVDHLHDAQIGAHKPAYDAYKTSIDVVTIDASTVQVFGLARSCKYGAVLEAYTPTDATWHEVLSLVVDELGYGQTNVASAGRTKWRLRCGADLYSREVAAR